MRCLKLVFLVTSMLLYSSLSFAQENTKIKCNFPEMQVFATDATYKPYIVIGELRQESDGLKNVFCRMKMAATKIQADAIINNTYSYREIVFVNKGTNFISSAYPTQAFSSGIAVRWARENEKGITKLLSGSKIPLLKVNIWK